jgi:hypothetical protein
LIEVMKSTGHDQANADALRTSNVIAAPNKTGASQRLIAKFFPSLINTQ